MFKSWWNNNHLITLITNGISLFLGLRGQISPVQRISSVAYESWTPNMEEGCTCPGHIFIPTHTNYSSCKYEVVVTRQLPSFGHVSIIRDIQLRVYIFIVLLEFLTNNVPRINQTTEMIDTKNYTLPDSAIGFFYGDPFSQTIINSSVFDISMTQITKHQNVSLPDIKTKVPL